MMRGCRLIDSFAQSSQTLLYQYKKVRIKRLCDHIYSLSNNNFFEFMALCNYRQDTGNLEFSDGNARVPGPTIRRASHIGTFALVGS